MDKILVLTIYADHLRETLKPRPHQQPRRSNIAECYKSNDSFDKVECCFNIVAVLATMLNEISSFRQSRNKIKMFYLSKGRNFTKKLDWHCYQIRQQYWSNILATMSNEISSFRQSRNKIKMFYLSKGRNFTKKLDWRCYQIRQQYWSNIRLCQKDGILR